LTVAPKPVRAVGTAPAGFAFGGRETTLGRMPRARVGAGPLSVGCGSGCCLLWPFVAAAVIGLSGGALAASTSASPRPLTGFGATVKEWDASHRLHRASGYGSPPCYNPMPGLAGRFPCRYGEPLLQGGRVVAYNVFLRPGTTGGQALRFALAQFPAGSRVVWSLLTYDCRAAEISSSRLRAVFGWQTVQGIRYRLSDWHVLFRTSSNPWNTGDGYDPTFSPHNIDELAIYWGLPFQPVGGSC